MNLYNFQKDGVKFLLQKKRAILADEMGLGKTAQAITASKYLANGPKEKVLIVAPKTLGRVWVSEIAKWAPGSKVLHLNGTASKKGVELLLTEAKYVICTYESLYSIEEMLKLVQIGCFIFDEAHKLKNRNAKMHKAAISLVQEFPLAYVFCLTATPLMNRAEELWALLHCIDPIAYSSFHNWAQYWLRTDEIYIPGKGWCKQYNVPRNPEAFKADVEQHMLRRLKIDAIDLPEKTFVTHEVELEGEQLQHYLTMANNYYMQWEGDEKEGNEITATAIIAAITRMKQIAISADLLKHKDLPNSDNIPLTGAKIDALEDLIYDATQGEGKVVVFSQFAQAIKRLHRQFSSLGYNCGRVTGEDTEKQRAESIAKFQDGNTQILFVGTQVGGLGITLTAAQTAIFMDLMWNPASNSQAADRLHRIGQRNAVTIYTLKAVNTVEDYILKLLLDKEELFNSVIPAARFESLNRKLEQNWRTLFGTR